MFQLGRTPLHYAYGLGEDSEEVIYILEAVGAKNSVPDYVSSSININSDCHSFCFKMKKKI